MRHRAVRMWFKPWRKRCACGCDWFPCPDSITMDRPGPVWNAQTAAYPVMQPDRPLMTRGQQWRSRGLAK